jgi:hypothetical protein
LAPEIKPSEGKGAEAKAKGYEGEACGECGNFTLVRNGTCLKCDTCGSTTGCSSRTFFVTDDRSRSACALSAGKRGESCESAAISCEPPPRPQ